MDESQQFSMASVSVYTEEQERVISVNEIQRNMKEKNQDENNKIPKGKGILQTIKEIEPIKIDMNKPITWEQLQEVFRKDRERND